jgi:hypothetical protein
MRRVLVFLAFLTLGGLCFAQQNASIRVIGRVPDRNSDQISRIQVGAFKNIRNAEMVFERIRRAGLSPAYEQYRDLTRVLARGIRARDVQASLEKLKQAGFREVIIREDQERPSFGAKWEITTPDSRFSSIEFDDHGNYLAVDESTGWFQLGKYTRQPGDAIDLADLGRIRIRSRNGGIINFSLAMEGGDEAAAYRARENRAARDNSQETNLLCRAWLTTAVNGRDVRGTRNEHVAFFSKAGTFFVTYLNRDKSMLGQWKWKDKSRKEFLFSWDNWETFGTDTIVNLSENFWKDGWGTEELENSPVWESVPY